MTGGDREDAGEDPGRTDPAPADAARHPTVGGFRVDFDMTVANVDFGHTFPIMTIPVDGTAVTASIPPCSRIR